MYSILCTLYAIWNMIYVHCIIRCTTWYVLDFVTFTYKAIPKSIFCLEYLWMTSLNNKFEKVLAKTFLIWLHLVSIGSGVYLYPQRPKAIENWPTTASCPANPAESGLTSLICNAVLGVRLSAMTDRTDPLALGLTAASFWQFQQLLLVYCWTVHNRPSSLNHTFSGRVVTPVDPGFYLWSKPSRPWVNTSFPPEPGRATHP